MLVQSVYILLGLFGVGYFLSSSREKALSPLAMYFVGTVVFIYPGALTRTADLWYVAEETEWLALQVIVGSILAAILGYAIAASFRRKKVIERNHSTDPTVSLTVLIGILVVSLLTKLYFDSDNFVSKFLMDTVRRTDAIGKYVEVLSYLPTSLACLCAWLWDRSRNKGIQAAIIIGLIALIGMFSLSRTPIFYILGTFLLYRIWCSQAVWKHRAWRAALLVAIISSLPLLTFFAALIKGSNMIVYSIENQDPVEYSAVYEFAKEKQYELAISDAYGNFLFILDHYPHVYSYQPGLTLEVLATAFIPRSIAPWKSWSPSYQFTSQILGQDTFERTGTSLITSFVGEMWMNGGWIAVLIGSIVVGIVANIIHMPIVRTNVVSSRRIIYLMTLILFFFVQRGDLLASVVRGVVYVSLAYLSVKAVIYFSGRNYAVSRPGWSTFEHLKLGTGKY